MPIKGYPAKILLESVANDEHESASESEKLAAQALARGVHPNVCLDETEVKELRVLINRIAQLYDQFSASAEAQAESLIANWCVKIADTRIDCKNCLSADYCSKNPKK